MATGYSGQFCLIRADETARFHLACTPMSLNESIVPQARDAALAMPVATLSHKESEYREAIRRLNPAIREEERAIIRQFRRVRIERRTDP